MIETHQTNELPPLLYMYEVELTNLSALLEDANLQDAKLSRLRDRIVTNLERTENMIKKIRRQMK